MDYLDTLNQINLKEIDLLKSNCRDFEMVIVEKDHQIELKEDQIDLIQLRLDREKEINKDQLKEIRKQRFHKNIAIICGSVATGFMTYLFITK